MFLPKIQSINRSSRTLTAFGGINRRESASINEFSDAMNMSAEDYPCVTTRKKKRYIELPVDNFSGLINNNGLYAFADEGLGTKIYKYDETEGTLIEKATLPEWLGAGHWECNKDTQSLFLGTDGLYSIDFSDPDKINGRTVSQEYRVKNKFVSNITGKIDPTEHGDYCRVRLFHEDGEFISEYADYADYQTLVDEHNANPADFGKGILYFVNVKGTNYRMAYRINPGVDTLIPADSVVARFLMPASIGVQLMKGDYIHIDGMQFFNGGSSVTEIEDMVNRYHEVINTGAQTSTITEGITIDEVYFDVRINVCYAVHDILRGYGGKGYFDGQTNPVKNQMFLYDDTVISLKVPELDCICEAQNRIWGASNKEHSIYCCEQGNVNNWYRYEGLSSDSWASAVGSEGAFTGCTSLDGSPVFFKENEIIAVQGSRPASYSFSFYDCPGVVKGSGNKICVHKGTIYYISRDGVYRFSSSGTSCISDDLCDGITNWTNASVFAHRNRLFVLLGKSAMYIYDLQKGIWHKEDGIDPQSVAVTNEGLVYVSINGESRVLVYDDTEMNTLAAEGEEDINWYLETKTLGNDIPAKKYLAQIDVALELRGTCTVSVKYDSSEWIRTREFADDKRKTEKLSFYPRRADHFKLRFEGEGHAKIFSITQTLEEAYENG